MEERKATEPTSVRPCIIVHGGAWAIPDAWKESSVSGVKKAAQKGYECLLKGGTAVDTVEAAVRILEDDPTFDAGHGSVLTEELTVEVDAMIMNGQTLESGAVAAVTGVANPVSLARRVMEDTPHSLLVGNGALKYAKKIDFPILSDPLALISEESRLQLEGNKNFNEAVLSGYNTETCNTGAVVNPGHDTVGAVAMDSSGRLACATSTGGISLKMPGRVGDSPLIGCGGYANKEGAVSTTGHGESIMKTLLAREVVCNMEGGYPPDFACTKALEKMFEQVGGQGGAIAINKHGKVGRGFTTKRMPWATITEGILKFGIEPNEEISDACC
ncbi:isoaspartyl peptidase/L-asparaginase [Pocillopora verrucosa]|uniref:isoaspartyl peptidase/L-asparaginase n=1 Tax=Pocillopora verrucosa TaxID=203993 RepID=UPI00333FC04C